MALSRFAGMYNASAFAYGINPQVPALQVINGPAVTGSGTLTLVYGTFSTADGTQVTPLNTNAPITVGGNSNTETVTPSAVSASTPLIYGTATVTATFTYVHGNGDSIRSGTCGLQEALNAASGFGGGEVIVDAGWVKLGGTQAMLDAATVPAGVTIQDNRGSGQLATMTKTLTSAQLLTLNGTPVELLPAPDALSYYLVLNATLTTSSGTAYTGGSAITIGYGTTAATNAMSGTIASALVAGQTTVEAISIGNGVTSATAGSSLLGKPIYITNATANFATGTQTLQINLIYEKIFT
jgi:hypothetical protein